MVSTLRFSHFLIVLIFMLGCSSKPSDEAKLVNLSDISESDAHFVINASDQEFISYCDSLPLSDCIRHFRDLDYRQHQISSEEFKQGRRVWENGIFRVADAIYQLRGIEGYRNRVLHYRQLDDHELQAYQERRRESYNFYLGHLDDSKKRIEKAEEDLLYYTQINSTFSMAQTYLTTANGYLELGQDGKAEWCRWRSLELFLANGDSRFGSQILGELGQIKLESGRPDSMQILWNQARELADKHRMPLLTARIDLFFAHYNRDLGRYATSERLFKRALKTFRDHKGGEGECRILCEAMEFYAEFGCWEAVQRLNWRLQIVQRRFEETMVLLPRRELWRSKIIQARYLMANGRIGQGDSLFTEIRNNLLDNPWGMDPIVQSELLLGWGTELKNAGRLNKAKTILAENYALTLGINYDLGAAQSALSLGELALFRRNLDQAERFLESFLQHANETPGKLHDLWQRYDLACIELTRSRGEALSTLELQVALSRLDGFVSSIPPSAHAYLFLQKFDALRNVLHDVLVDEPQLSYELEMAWRHLPMEFGQQNYKELTTRDLDDPLALISRWIRNHGGGKVAMDLGHSLAERPGSFHVMYALNGDNLGQWVNNGQNVRYVPLPVKRHELNSMIHDALEEVIHGKQLTNSAICDSLLSELGRILLPVEATTTTTLDQPGLALISPVGILRSLPFEILKTRDSQRSPLLTGFDVAYLRVFYNTGSTEAKTKGIILANPSLSEEIHRTMSGLGDLENASEMAMVLSDLDPEMLVLSGADASRTRLLENWEGTERIHIAAHVVRHPDIPFVSFVPLAATNDKGSIPLLEITDIREADLSSCELVTLSTCTSGACFVEGDQTAPSLGDAFLDAGAQSVVQTFWQVEDSIASELMKDFYDRMDKGLGPIAALSAVRRQRMGDLGALAPVQEWANYAVQVVDVESMP